MSIHFSPNMSYCAVENTARAMDQVIALMAEHDSPEEWRAGLNEYELQGLEYLTKAIAEFEELTADLEVV